MRSSQFEGNSASDYTSSARGRGLPRASIGGRRAPARQLGALAVAVLLTACASAPTRVFTLTQVPPARPTPSITLRDPIEVGEVPVPAGIDRSSIVIFESNSQLFVSPNDEWAGPLGSLIRQALTADLQSRLGVNNVLPPGSVAPNGRLRILNLTIQQFIGDTSGRVVLNTGWALLNAGSSHVVHSGHEMITVQAISGKVPDIVPAMSRALAQLADRIAQQLAA